MGAAEQTYALVDYLAIEAETGQKYEYYDGFLVAMAGGTPTHAQLAMNMGAMLFALLGQNCIAYSSDARVSIEEANAYVYPDVTVVCGPLAMGEAQSIANPSLLVEVTSETSELYDRGDKFRLYRSIPSLQQYVLVSQKSPSVETYLRNSDGTWTFSEASGLEASIRLASVDITLPLADIYRKVAFEGK